MCLQSKKRTLLVQMGCVCLAAFLVVTVIVIVSGSAKERDNEEAACIGNLSCLKTSECLNYDHDIAYSCGLDDVGNTKICCKAKQISTLFQDRAKHSNLLSEECGISFNGDKIANGLNASPGQFPWMALLGYTTKKISIPQYLCGGTLINQRYILTAAHCTFIKSMKLTTVRLGELNLEKNEDCVGQGDEQLCAEPPEDIAVEKVIPHPEYSNATFKNDIALIRLAKNISEFTEFIQPVCLPFGIKAEGKYLTSKKFLISGWGKTSSSSVGVSSILQYTIVDGWDLKRCNKALPAKVRPINTTQICATGKDFKEACKGDSGGPLTDDVLDGATLRTKQIGIVSFKALNTCGTEDLPTVFTRVDQYIDWIVDTLRP